MLIRGSVKGKTVSTTVTKAKGNRRQRISGGFVRPVNTNGSVLFVESNKKISIIHVFIYSKLFPVRELLFSVTAKVTKLDSLEIGRARGPHVENRKCCKAGTAL